MPVPPGLQEQIFPKEKQRGKKQKVSIQLEPATVEAELGYPLPLNSLTFLGTTRHLFTHIEHNYAVCRLNLEPKDLPPLTNTVKLVSAEELEKLAVPKGMTKCFQLV